MSELTKLSGVGEATKEKLQKAGFKTLDDIVNSSSQELVQKLGIDVTKAQKWIAEARSILTEERIVIESASQILNFQESIIQCISTGSKKLDALLGGGVFTDAITMCGGSYGTGKTQLGYQLAINCVHDLGRKAVWIETEPSTFKPKRLIEMSTFGKNKPIDLEKDIFAIRSDYLQTPEKLHKAYQMVENEIIKGKAIDVGIIVVDSFTALFRSYYQGRGRLSERGEELARHIGTLQKLASKYNLAVFLTSQVYGVPEDSGEERRRMGIYEHIYGGEYFLHSATVCISLEQVKGGQSTTDVWNAYVFKAPDMPRKSTEFVICREGVRDL